MKKFKTKMLVLLTLSAAAISAGCLVACNSQSEQSSEHEHNLTHHAAVAATCTDEGDIEYWSCSGCGQNFSDSDGTTAVLQVTIPADGHNLTHHAAVAATCTDEGNIEYWSCGVCRQNFSDSAGTAPVSQTVTPTTGHNWGQWAVYEAAQNCHEKDVERRVCFNDNTHYEEREGQSGPHSYVDGFCQYCGDNQSNGLEFEENSEGYTVTGIGTFSGSVLYIPEEYDGQPVTAIGRRAFSETDITEVIIPDSVKQIDYYAFEDCDLLENVTIGDGVEVIQSGAFARCSNLTEINFGKNVRELRSECFVYCSGLREVTIPASVEEALSVFNGCTSLERVTFEDNSKLEWLGLYFFYNCTSLKEVNFGTGSSLEYIDNSAFYNCTSLQSIELPDSVTAILYGAFSSCTALADVQLSASLEYIASHAFADCASLEGIVIPKSTTFINHNAFTGSQNLTSLVVEEGNPVYHSQGNCIIKTATKTLTHGCAGSVIPTDDSVTSIGTWAFGEYMGLKKVFISQYITEIDFMAFHGCGGLEQITVDPLNPVYHSDGNCLIDTAEKSVLRGCANSVIPTDGSVTYISDGAFINSPIKNIYISADMRFGDNAFNGCTQIESITVEEGNQYYYSQGNCLISKSTGELIKGCKNSQIPANVKSIRRSAFEGCDIQSVTLPADLQSLEYRVFADCANLTDIYFGGTVEQWNAIEKHTEWDEGTGPYTVHCSDGII